MLYMHDNNSLPQLTDGHHQISGLSTVRRLLSNLFVAESGAGSSARKPKGGNKMLGFAHNIALLIERIKTKLQHGVINTFKSIVFTTDLLGITTFQ